MKLKSPPGKASTAGRRLRILAGVALVWVVLVVLRLLQLQVVSHGEYVRLAQQQQQQTVEIRPPRGTIRDRSGEPLAMSLPIYSACVNPLRIKDVRLAADLLAGALQMKADDLHAQISKALQRRSGFLWIKRKLTDEEYERLALFRLEGLEFRLESQRYYPKGPLAAHVVGSVNFDQHGDSGLEMSLDKELRGQPGALRVLTDVRKRSIESHVFAEVLAGKHITLTLDERVQHVAERELLKAVREHDAWTGSIVVMDPHQGDVLALANYPSFDPNQPVSKDQPVTHRANLAISSPYEPGSVFKLVTMAAALETTRLRPETMIDCPSVLALPGRVVHEAKARGHQVLSLADVFAKSSNVGTIKVGLQVGPESLLKYVRALGFGRRAGLPLPYESPGLVRPLEQWQPRNDPRKTNSLASVAIGHEISASALQLAQACSIVANGGLLVRPRLILRREQPGTGDDPLTAKEPPRRVLKPETAFALRRMMIGVVDHGTGKGAQLVGYSSAGKTGTAQIFDFKQKLYTHYYNGSFMGFAPVNNPQVVVVVTLNGVSKYGGTVAAPVFKEIAHAAMRFLDVPRDLPVEDDIPDDRITDARPSIEEPTRNLTLADIGAPLPIVPASAERTAMGPQPQQTLVFDYTSPKVPDFRNKSVRQVLHEASALGLAVDLVGSGLARSQVPPAGEQLPPGSRVTVTFVR